jgi:O-antigen/teichoic acid export membrane protein
VSRTSAPPSSHDVTGDVPLGQIGRTARTRAVPRDGTAAMLALTVAGGMAAYVWQAVGTRTLDEHAFSPVAQAWTVMFLIVTILLAPVEQFATRTVATGAGGRAHLAAELPQIRRAGIAATLAIAATCLALRDVLFGGSWAYAVICGSMVLGFGQLLLTRGVLSGERRFASYGWLTASDGVVRVVIGVPVLLVTGSAVAFAATIPLATLVGLGWRRHWPRRKEAQHDPLLGVRVAPFLAATVAANAAAQLIMAGGPLVLAFLGATGAAVTALFVTQTAFRALFFIATPGWSRLLPAFTRIHVRQEHLRLRLIAERILIASVVGAVVAAAGAALVGPALIGTLFGGGARPSALLAAATAAGTVLAVGNLGLNQVLIARVKTARITAAWWIGLAAMAAWAVLGPGDEVDRVAISFVIGEGVAMLALTAAASPRLLPPAVRRVLLRLRGRHNGTPA